MDYRYAILWGDEVASWRYAEATLDNARLGLRLGRHPQMLLTTTPRPLRWLREMVAGATEPVGQLGAVHHLDRAAGVVVSAGTTYDNLANLPESFRQSVLSRYEGTSVGAQELRGELLLAVEGALWSRGLIDAARLSPAQLASEWGELGRVVVSLDPSGTAGGDETGIVVVGSKTVGRVEHYLVLEDASAGLSPVEWARRAITLAHSHDAERVVAEVNYGADMVEHTISTTPGGERLAFRALRASRNKRARAEPVVGLYEQGRVHHLGVLTELEDQLCGWVPGVSDYSPGRLDALVWAVSDLAFNRGAGACGVGASVAG